MSQQLDWPRYSRWTWILALLAIVALIWLWMTGRGPNATGCCGAPVVATAPAPAPAVAPTVATPAAAVSSAAPVAVAASPVEPAARAEDVKCSSQVAIAATFATGSAQLSPGAAKLLGAVVPCITSTYEVGGHTDNVGQPANNQALSERRAAAVQKFMVSKGVDAKLLSSKGYGDTVPIGDNATAAGKAKNRRIEFKKM